MNKYELVYILKTATDDETKEKVANKIKEIIETNGNIESIDVWGNKKLAYEIQKLTDGYYVLVKFNAGAGIPKELDRNLKIMDQVIRHLIVNVDNN
ncbi:30S ribosomal protein S6 [Criibacterium bergeronii]|uniref:Small ribosomal subunit protein bS6 n=1 Tax=Criibacterium bergeronii TaxID=1871336 RepID=A0A552VCL1_9FIRM|nr:30S ribosomal protein S6 [Criibacterium bergeronii]TRW28214.1 30S ribosomal protein S6 [Criibacterium bergeronii]